MFISGDTQMEIIEKSIQEIVSEAVQEAKVSAWFDQGEHFRTKIQEIVNKGGPAIAQLGQIKDLFKIERVE